MTSAQRSDVTIRPARHFAGSVRLPGDKSISHRYGMLAAIAQGETQLSNFSTGADCASTLACMQALGATVTREGDRVHIRGIGRHLKAPAGPLDCGNSGSTMRMLSGILAGQSFATTLVGDASLSRRPMKRIIDPLERMGARVEAQDGHAPLVVHGGSLRAIEYKTPVASAQVKSCVLLAGLYADGETHVEEPTRTRDHTEIALQAFGAEVQRSKTRVTIAGDQALHGIEAVVPGDISTSAFFLCAAALFPDSNLLVDALLLNPTRAQLLDVMIALGLRIKMLNVEAHHCEVVGTVQAQGGELKGLKISGELSSALIDELPVLAAIAPFTRDGIEIRDARELRVKESDRIAAVAQNLRAMGARVEEYDDGLRVAGQQKLHGAEIDSHEDHRIAMAFSVAALRAEGESVIHGADAARISYPEFYDTLQALAQS
jgi:3-phosphoshikimate 1-carboxyvinyltransferase